MIRYKLKSTRVTVHLELKIWGNFLSLLAIYNGFGKSNLFEGEVAHRRSGFYSNQPALAIRNDSGLVLAILYRGALMGDFTTAVFRNRFNADCKSPQAGNVL